MITNRQSEKINYLRLLQFIVFSAVILYFGRSLFIPLSFALLISFILYPVCKWLEAHKIPRVGAIAISIFIIIVLLGGLVTLLISQAIKFGSEWPALKEKLSASLDNIRQYLHSHFQISWEEQSQWVSKMLESTSSGILPFLKETIYASAISAVLIILIPFYVALILYYRSQLVSFLFYIFSDHPKHKIINILDQTITTFYNFIKGMLIVYIIVAVLNCAGLAILGIPHAILFGVIASILTFIPYVGIMIGALLPITIAWITYDSAWYPLGVIIVFTIVQYLEANVIFPLAVSYRLQVNTLFTLMAIIAGGILWGASGMILFIPFLGILKLIADHSEQLKGVSLLLGVENDKKPAKKSLFARKVK